MRKLNFAEHELVARIAITVASNHAGTVLDGLIQGFSKVGKPLSQSAKRKLTRKMEIKPREIIDWIFAGYGIQTKIRPITFRANHTEECKKESEICDCDPMFTVDGEVYLTLAETGG